MKIERPTRSEAKKSERTRIRGRPAGARTKGLLTRKAKDIGAHSRPWVLAKVDRRTLQGRYVDKVRAELVDHVGGHPSAVQKMLIERACMLSLRLVQIDDRIITNCEFTEVDSNMTIAWSNCLTRTLVAIGIHPEAAKHGPTTSFDAVLKELGGGYADAAD